MRGDGPLQEPQTYITTMFSPHAWGWSALKCSDARCRKVFPTCVGMVRRWYQPHLPPLSFPHMRGDGPGCTALQVRINSFSPHAWGWSV